MRVPLTDLRPYAWLGLLFCIAAAQAATSTPTQIRSITASFEADLATQEWQRAFTDSAPTWSHLDGAPRPIEVRLVDLETGRESLMDPAVAYEVDGRRRWGGRTLDVDWVVVLDAVTGPVRSAVLSIQLKADRLRFLQLDAGIPARGATDFWPRDPNTAARDSTPDPAAESVPTVLGSVGERARLPFALLEQPAETLLASVDPNEPRLFRFVAEPEDGYFGVRFETCLTPETGLFPGRAVFRLAFAAWPATPDTAAAERANEIHNFLWPTPDESDTTPTATASIPPVGAAWYPLIFTPRFRAPDSTLHSSWTPQTLPQPVATGETALHLLEESLHVQSLDQLENYARDARVRIESNSTETGFDVDALADGVTQVDGEHGAHLGWRSADRAAPHYIHLRLPAPTALSSLLLHWPRVDQLPVSARALRIYGITANEEHLLIAQVDQPDPVALTSIALPEAPLRQLTIEMPAGGGSPEYPNQLWLCEIELR